MFKQYALELKIQAATPTKLADIKSHFAYYLYAVLLENCPTSFAEQLHDHDFTPIAHKLLVKNNKIIWSVSLFHEAIPMLGTVLLTKKEWHIKKENLTFIVSEVKEKVVTAEDLFQKSRTLCSQNCSIKLEFATATAFKSKGIVQNMPSNHFIFQSLSNKWNHIFPEAMIEDEDGEGMDSIALCMQMRDFRLQGAKYALKKQNINGFCGTIVYNGYDQKIEPFHKELAYALLLLSEYSGIGMKSTLGMGGVLVRGL